MIGVEFRELEVAFDTRTPPPWAPAVDRWYQLDAPAFALAEAGSRWTDLPPPRLVVGASAGASNASDREFLAAPRAHRFVHTLPSVRYAALCQVVGWAGPLLCVQRDPSTLVAGLALGADFHEASGETWVLGARAVSVGAVVELFRLGASGSHRLERDAVTEPVDDARLRSAIALRRAISLEGGWRLVPN